MDQELNGVEVMAAGAENIPQLQQPATKKRKVADDDRERSPLMDRKLNINETMVNDDKNPSQRQRSRLPQPSLKKIKLTATVDNRNLAMVVKNGSGNVACTAASNNKMRSNRSLSIQGGVRLAQTVNWVATRSRAVNSATTLAGVVVKKSAALKSAPAVAAPSSVQPAAASKKRPAWDLKGQLGDVKVQLGNVKSQLVQRSCRLLVSEQESRQLKESVELTGKQLAAADLQIEELKSNLVAMELLLKKTKAELEKCQGASAVMQEVLQARGTEVERLTADVDEMSASNRTLSAVVEETKNKLTFKDQELTHKVAFIAEQQTTIASLRDVVVDQEERLHCTEQERRKLHNTVQELKGNIRVICRMRPVLDSEKEAGSELEHVQFLPNDEKVITLTKMEESHIGRDRKGEVKHDFSFDRVFQPMASQKDVFEDISQLIQSALDGYNVCIFAYGQTGSGKTFTMEGPDDLTSQTKGMIPRAVDQIFLTAQQLKAVGWTYKFTASFLEIYNETLRDLLVTKPEKAVEYEIKRLCTKSEQLYVTNLKYISVSTEEEVHNLIAIAKANRSVARTIVNDRSSRSHSVFQLKIEGSNSARDLQYSSTLSLVDLAGSERLDKSHSKGDRLREAQAINTSLSSLGHVIMSLSKKEAHIPYRNSKLTYLLQNSLGGNSKTLMFVNISPLEENFNESLNSLRFASQVNDCVIGTAQVNRK